MSETRPRLISGPPYGASLHHPLTKISTQNGSKDATVFEWSHSIIPAEDSCCFLVKVPLWKMPDWEVFHRSQFCQRKSPKILSKPMAKKPSICRFTDASITSLASV